MPARSITVQEVKTKEALKTFLRRGQARGVRWGEMSWILEDNHLMQKGLEALGAKIYKTCRIYRAPL